MHEEEAEGALVEGVNSCNTEMKTDKVLQLLAVTLVVNGCVSWVEGDTWSALTKEL